MMEKIFGAQAMEWSIELDKGLRSKEPDQAIKAVTQIGCKLKEWSKEPPITLSISNMFNLVPGEDRLFANTIFLRLADAFQGGDNHIRASILKIFLLESKQRMRTDEQYNGLLAKHRVPNYLELIRRVKTVYDTGDVESKAIVLRLFGCWADFALHSVEVRCLVLSCMESQHNLELKAAIFAAGCFSFLSEEFASFVLGKLTDIATSSCTLSKVKRVALQAFAKMTSSILVTKRAYKAGKKLIMDSLSEELVIEFLPPLTKLASRSVSLIPEQVELLTSFFIQKPVGVLSVKALKCLQFLADKGISNISFQTDTISKLLHVVDDNNYSNKLQCGSLQILCKIFPCVALSLPSVNVAELVIRTAKCCAKSWTSYKSCLAFNFLVELTVYIKRNMGSQPLHVAMSLSDEHMLLQGALIDADFVVSHNDLSPLPKFVSSLILNHLTMLVKELKGSDRRITSFAVLQWQYLLSLCIRIVQEYPILAGELLDGVKAVAEVMVSRDDNPRVVIACSRGDNSSMGTNSNVFCSDGSISPPLSGKDENPTISELALCICKFLGAFLETLDGKNILTSEIAQMVRSLTGFICQGGILNSGTCFLYFLQLETNLIGHSSESKKGTESDMDKSMVDLATTSPNSSWVEHECAILSCAKKMWAAADLWRAYRTGIYAACQGSWFTATFIFNMLTRRVKSSVYSNWLNALAMFSGGECEILLLLYPVSGLTLMNGLRTQEHGMKVSDKLADEADRMNQNFNVLEYRSKLSKARARVCAAEEMLVQAITLDGPTYFQSWFLKLRVKFLQNMIDLSGLLDIENISQLVTADENLGMKSSLMEQQLAKVSGQFYSLAKEFDVFGTSFMDIDYKSYTSIARATLICYLMAFSVACMPQFPVKSLDYGQKKSQCLMARDLHACLCHVGQDICTDLQKILAPNLENSDCKPQFGLQNLAWGHREKEILSLCKFSVERVVKLLDKADEGNKDGNLPCQNFMTSITYLSRLGTRVMYVLFQTPKYFFTVRPSMGAELFIFSADAKNSREVSVLLGSHLSLNLCIQLKNKFEDCPTQICKVFCLIVANQEAMESHQPKTTNQDSWNTVKMATELHEELLLHISGARMQETAGEGMANAFVSFKLNDRGQGFSTCLFDVSSFPSGFYKLQWCSCCIDNNSSLWNLLPLNSDLVINVRRP